MWGSDAADSALLDDVRSLGIHVSLNQDGSALPEEIDLLVYSEAIPESAPERKKARERGVREISYFHALGEMTAGSELIAVCGTHGKSSTTAMSARILMEAGMDPNVVVGTKLRELSGKNWRKGNGNLWIVEACEYRRSFLHLSPTIIIITNADGDHFDAFASVDEYRKAFVDVISLLPEGGTVIAHGSDKQVTSLIEQAGASLIDADAEPLIPLKTPGAHMRKNAQLALSLARYLGIPERVSQAAISEYSGSWRRMERRGETHDGIPVIDDYAHHPVEIAATLSAMKELFPTKRRVVVFQPHTHHRTLTLWDGFATAFTDADVVIITDVYDARPDRDAEMANVKKLVEAIRSHGKREVYAGGTLDDTEKLLRSGILRQDDALIFLGAGTITRLAGKMAQRER